MRHLSATMAAKNTLWMCVALAAAILAVWLVVVLAAPTKRAEAAFPGQNGKIAFLREIVRDSDILTMKANGDNKTALTTSRADDYAPAFSPNGRKIAFERNGDIYTMSANGTNKKNVTTSASFESQPDWSPDGTKISFASSRTGENDIYVIYQDGSGLTRLTTSPQRDEFDPTWSPDGTRIAFVSRTPNNNYFKIYVMKAARVSETNRPQRLTTSGSHVGESRPDWSPNGTRIAFVRTLRPFTDFADNDLYSIRADGSGQIQLTNSSDSEFDPTWSPDGTKIAFTAERGSYRNWGIYVMKAAPESATNRPKRLTGDRFDTFVSDWQPLR